MFPEIGIHDAGYMSDCFIPPDIGLPGLTYSLRYTTSPPDRNPAHQPNVPVYNVDNNRELK